MLFTSADTVQVIPRTTGVYTKGRYLDSADSAYNLTDASVQPASDGEIQSLPEGMREQSALRLYTISNLNSLKEDQNPDHVVISGVEYEIYSKNIWNNMLIPHYKYLISEVI